MGVKKPQSVPPFTFFGTVTLFKNLISKFFWEIVKSPKGSPSVFVNFCHKPAGVSQSPKGPPFTILSLRFSADFGRSRLVGQNDHENDNLLFARVSTKSLTLFYIPLHF